MEALRQQIQEISGELEAARTEHKVELASTITSHQAELLAVKQVKNSVNPFIPEDILDKYHL